VLALLVGDQPALADDGTQLVDEVGHASCRPERSEGPNRRLPPA